MISIQFAWQQSARLIGLVLIALVMLAAFTGRQTHAQYQKIRGAMPPGSLAYRAQLADPNLETSSQPVKFVVPDGLSVQIWNQGNYGQIGAQDLMVGLQIGPVYRLKVTSVIRGVTQEVYPSIEMIDRLYQPDEFRLRHPVKVVIDPADIESALSGRMVNKVIYLEDPKTALPYRQTAFEQPFFDVSYRENPVEVADSMGRPMAVLRIGSRRPDLASASGGFAFYSPPVDFYNYQAIQNQQNQNFDNPNFYRQPFPPAAVPENRQPADGSTTRSKPKTDIQAQPASYAQSTERDSYAEHPLRMVASEPAKAPAKGPAKEPAKDQLPPIVAAPLCPPCVTAPHTIVTRSLKSKPDEFVCDGSDNEDTALVDSNWNVYGLNIEDTIGHFDTLDGKRIVAPSNKVCIYSPRFAAVRQLIGPGQARFTAKANAAIDRIPIIQRTGRDVITHAKQNVQVQQNRLANHASGLRETTRGVSADNTVQLVGTRSSFKGFEDLQFTRHGKFTKSEMARLGAAVQSAVAWDIDVAPQLTVEGAQPVIVNDVYKLQEIVGIEVKGSHPTLRLCKLASRISAKPGDVVDFTIRFDNIGRDVIGNVTIIDNLSPRLEYIADTAECSVDAEFKTTPNEAGSLTMRWEIDKPLEVRDGGLIRFQCRVR